MDKVSVVIQARSTSNRLPNKGLVDIGDHKAIDLVIDACRRAHVGPVVVAVPRNDPIGRWVSGNGSALVVEGSEDNVLERYYRAASASGCDHAVRVTGDCPLLWPDLIRWLVMDHIAHDNDMTTVCREPYRVPDGLDVEVVSMPLLRYLLDYADYPESREHVTWHVYRHWDELSEQWRLEAVRYPLPMGDKYSLDTEVDLERIRAHVAAAR